MTQSVTKNSTSRPLGPYTPVDSAMMLTRLKTNEPMKIASARWAVRSSTSNWVARGVAPGQGHVQGLAGEPGVEDGGVQRLLARRQRVGDDGAHAVHHLALKLALVGRQRAQRLQPRGDAAVLAQQRDPQLFQPIGRGRGGNVGQRLFLQRIEFAHVQRIIGARRPRPQPMRCTATNENGEGLAPFPIISRSVASDELRFVVERSTRSGR